MKYFKKFIYVGIFFLLIGVPIYAAGRIIIPNLLKERIVNSLPAGSTLSISNIYSDTDLTINYEEVKEKSTTYFSLKLVLNQELV